MHHLITTNASLFPLTQLPSIRRKTSNLARTRRFPKGKTEKDIPSFSFNSWQSHRAKWYAPCNGPVWSNENPTRLTSAPFGAALVQDSYERLGQGLRWNFQHRLSCTYCAISVWDQNPQQVNHGTRGVRISERFLRSIVGISELLLR